MSFANGVRIQLTNSNSLPYMKGDEMAVFRNAVECVSHSKLIHNSNEIALDSVQHLDRPRLEDCDYCRCLLCNRSVGDWNLLGIF